MTEKAVRNNRLKALAFVVIVVPIAIYQAWGWVTVSKDSYLNSKTSCQEFFNGVQTAIAERNETVLKRTFEKLSLSMVTELLNVGNEELAKKYVDNKEVASQLNFLLKSRCESEPKTRLSVAIEQTAKSTKK